jgi:hypothetical protein
MVCIQPLVESLRNPPRGGGIFQTRKWIRRASMKSSKILSLVSFFAALYGFHYDVALIKLETWKVELYIKVKRQH